MARGKKNHTSIETIFSNFQKLYGLKKIVATLGEVYAAESLFWKITMNKHKIPYFYCVAFVDLPY